MNTERAVAAAYATRESTGLEPRGRPHCGEPCDDVTRRPVRADTELAVACDYTLPASALALLAEMVVSARVAKGAKTEAA